MYFGSVDSMKGNEARIIFFLHAVDQFKGGQVQRKQVISNWQLDEQEPDNEKREERGEKRKYNDETETEPPRKRRKEEVLLTTKPYYLAITRSSCEVSLIFKTIFKPLAVVNSCVLTQLVNFIIVKNS